LAETVDLLGALAPVDAGRDAIHIAVVPVIAGHILTPGEHVGWMDETQTTVGRVLSTLGVVDPFLKAPVMPHERCFLFLYPKSITGLRHVWSHPAFPDGDVVAPIVTKSHAAHKAQSEEWIRGQADRIDIGFNELLHAAERWLRDDDHTVQNGGTSWRDNFGDPAEFWHHYEIYTGTVVPQERKSSFFCCSC